MTSHKAMATASAKSAAYGRSAAYAIESRHTRTTAVERKPAPQLLQRWLNLDPDPVDVNECVHDAVQHGDGPDRPATDPQAGKHNAE